jgi:subtilisin family serine protease
MDMSLGGGYSESMETACDEANAYPARIVLVAAAGNGGDGYSTTDEYSYPAAYGSVIAVGATNTYNVAPYWSNSGPYLELAAPGVDIYSTYMGGGYATMSGTSMACPHVAGTAALAIGESNVRQCLQDTAEDLGEPGKDNLYGYGLVDAEAAAGSAVTLELIAVTPESSSIPKGLTQQYTATGTYSDASTADITSSVTWASSDTAVATIDLVGLAIGEGAGTTTITASSNSISDTATLTVTLALESIAVTPESASIPKGLTQQYTAMGTYSDDSTADITSSVTWESSDTAVATIDSAGLATGEGAGTTTITASSNLISDTAALTVMAPSEPTAVIVESISYSTEGGKNQDRHLCIAVALVDNLGNPVADASVSIDVYLEGPYVSYTGTTGTDGTVTFKKNNAPSGTYTTTVTAVIAGELIWDGVTPPENSFIKY